MTDTTQSGTTQPGIAHVDTHDHHDHAQHDGHGRHGGHGDHIKQFRDRFWWNLLLAIPVVVFSQMFADLIGYTRPAGTDWISPVLGTVIFFYGGWPFLSGGVSEARARQPGMMLLIALAITVAFTASLATSLGVGNLDLDFWWELALLVVIMLLGHWLEMKAIGQAQGALAALAELLPDVAERVTADGVETVPLAELQPGDVVLVRSGARVPADGVIVDGEAELDESMITGESRPVPKRAGDRVVAGTVTTDSAIRVRVEAVGDDTALAGIQRLVAQAQASRSRAQALADRAAGWLFYVAAGAGIVTFVTWMLVGNCRRGRGAHRHGSGHRVPARARSRDPTRDRALHRRRRARRHPGEGPDGARADARDQRGVVRQDRHPHQRAARRHRRRGRRQRRPLGRRAPRARRRGGVRQ